MQIWILCFNFFLNVGVLQIVSWPCMSVHSLLHILQCMHTHSNMHIQCWSIKLLLRTEQLLCHLEHLNEIWNDFSLITSNTFTTTICIPNYTNHAEILKSSTEWTYVRCAIGWLTDIFSFSYQLQHRYVNATINIGMWHIR